MDTTRRQQIANQIASTLESYGVDDAVIGGASWDIAGILQDHVVPSIDAHRMTPAQRREFERGKRDGREDVLNHNISYDIDLATWYGKGYADELDVLSSDF